MRKEGKRLKRIEPSENQVIGADNIIDVETSIVPGTERVDYVTPVIEKKTTLVQDKKGNKLLWISIGMAILCAMMLIHSLFKTI